MWIRQIAELTTCDCSICVKRNAVMAKVPEKSLAVLDGEEMLTLYESGIRVGRKNTTSAAGAGSMCSIANARPPRALRRQRLLPGWLRRGGGPVRATEGANMTIEDPAAHPGWPGPRGG